MRNEMLTVQEAANICGVSSSTFKRMCETESIPLSRTPGGHRRIERLDLERLSNKYMRARHVNVSLSANTALTAEHVLAELLEGRAFQVAQLFTRSTHDSLDLIRALEDCLIAALWKVGDLWRAKRIDVYQEHLCTNTALTALDILRQHTQAEVTPKHVAVGCAFVPSIESLPSKLVALCFDLVGIKAIDLGAFLPPASLARAAIDFNARIVWITHTHVTDAETLLANHLELRDLLPAETRIVIGGGGMSPALRRSLAWCHCYESLSQMVRTETNIG